MYPEWLFPSTIPPLSFEGIQLWRLHTEDIGPFGLTMMYEQLSSDERTRADAIRVQQVRREFVTGRGLLRLLLGAASGVNPPTLLLEQKGNGKPSLADAFALEFNVSHSEGLIVVALSRAGMVGVDVEFLSEEFAQSEELEEIARESFYAEEFSAIVRTPAGPARLQAFYEAWTRRESVAKADGRGIASLLKYRVDSADEFGEHRVLLATAVDAAATADDQAREVEYFVQTPPVRPQYLAAVASRKQRQAITLLDASRIAGRA